MRAALATVARGFALFLGGFALLNLLVGWRNPGLDMNSWWVDLRPLPGWIAQPALSLSALFLLGFGSGVRWRWARRVTLAVTVGLLAAAAWNAAQYYRLRAGGGLHSGVPIPFALLLVVAFTVVVLAEWKAWGWRPGWCGRAGIALVFAASLVGFPVAQIYCFGTTDYRRPADAIVVFGAHATGSGRPSPALADRVRTACALYHDGYAPLLVFSGGPTKGKAHETDAMRNLAHELGVPDNAIVVDTRGLSTYETVRNTTRLFPLLGVHRVIAVSHFYHLPRIKMSYQRAGWEVFTVPAQHPRQSPREYPFMVFRETAATWAYFLWAK